MRSGTTINAIAQFSKPRAFAYVALNFVICASIISIANYHPPGTSLFQYATSQGRFRPLMLLAPLVVPLLILLQIVILRQVLFRRGRAVWVIDGHLYFLNFYKSVLFSQVSISDIDHLSIKQSQILRSDAVVLHLNDGRLFFVPTGLLAENVEIILSRLSVFLRES